MLACDPQSRKPVQSRETLKIQNENANTKPERSTTRVLVQIYFACGAILGCRIRMHLMRERCVCVGSATHCERGWWVGGERACLRWAIWMLLEICEWERRKLESPITSSPWAQRCSHSLSWVWHILQNTHTATWEHYGLAGSTLCGSVRARVYLPHSTPRAECERAMIAN